MTGKRFFSLQRLKIKQLIKYEKCFITNTHIHTYTSTSTQFRSNYLNLKSFKTYFKKTFLWKNIKALFFVSISRKFSRKSVEKLKFLPSDNWRRWQPLQKKFSKRWQKRRWKNRVEKGTIKSVIRKIEEVDFFLIHWSFLNSINIRLLKLRQHQNRE